jgi:hypothetical protein
MFRKIAMVSASVVPRSGRMRSGGDARDAVFVVDVAFWLGGFATFRGAYTPAVENDATAVSATPCAAYVSWRTRNVRALECCKQRSHIISQIIGVHCVNP